jgi:hypothetical protein
MIGNGMVESGRKRFNDRFTCCYYSAILWSEDHLFDTDASNNAVSVFIVSYDFASDCTTEPQGTTFQQFKQLFMMGSKEPHDEQ